MVSKIFCISCTFFMSSFQDTQDIVTLLGKSPKNCVIALQQNLETTADLFAALNQMHEVVVNIQGKYYRNTFIRHLAKRIVLLDILLPYH